MGATEEDRITADRRVLVVEDDRRLQEVLRRAIADMEFMTTVVGSAEEALRELDRQAFGLMLVDLNLPGMSGLELCADARDRWPYTQAIILTGHGDLDAARQAIRLDVVDFLTKPASLGEIESALDRALRRRLHNIVARQIDDDGAAIMHEAQGDGDEPQRLRDVERESILTALARHDGNRSATAEELGISVRTLYYRLAEYTRQGFLAR